MIDEEIPAGALPDIFDYFGKCFIRQLDGFYAPLNSLLAEHGVQPGIEKQIQTRGSLLKRNQPEHRPQTRRRKPRPDGGQYASSTFGFAATTPASAINELNQIHQQLGEQLTGALAHVNPANLYRSVVDALNFKREAEGLTNSDTLASGTAMSGTWDGGTVASAELDQSKLADAQSIAKR